MQITNENKDSYIKKYTLQIGEVAVYENYMIAQLNEGITLNLDSIIEILHIKNEHFSKKPFAYITIRKNSYAVDPTMYLKVLEIENLKAIAIVSDKYIDSHNIKIEKHFFVKPMNIFKTLPEAITWATSHL
ncbi:STAS/SEC14 domain-containing protein [Kordia sp. YSTF-M3]|uniref:STAS/SEC14 domain-containing protein n=1 Tax=Kordia aestuariivivens TaxID=2759037 RepID=A0ABR7Q803_9FLAO|nr:STAS/SEC14 domain-containing protein [Kordia aestuariivivens]MBC8754697.1 STAS/SEC14 domain-containing protein [Kordia aestuariivivens]